MQKEYYIHTNEGKKENSDKARIVRDLYFFLHPLLSYSFFPPIANCLDKDDG